MNDKNKVAAIVPMKGHSERVKNKNLRDFNGKPLLWHILNTLRESKNISTIYVDTDSEMIEAAVKNDFTDIKIIWRPEELRGDFVSMNAVLRHDISVISETVYLQTHSTNPLLSAKTIDSAVAAFWEKEEKYDSLFSVNRLQTRLYDKAGKALNHDPNKLIRTQDLEPIYQENSNIYLFTKESFKKTNARIGKNPILFEMNPIESLDIDEESDFILAEQIHKLNKK